MTRRRSVTLLLLPLLVSQASAQTAAASPAVISSALLSRAYLAETSCVAGRPVVNPRPDSVLRLHGIDRAENVRHEAIHFLQLAPGCDSIMAEWNLHPAERMAAEVEATCVGIKWYADSARRARRRDDARTALMMLYGPTIGASPVYDAFASWCAP